MKANSEYKGGFVNHIEALYRPGDRELAIELVEALGCVPVDTGFKTETGSTYLIAQPEAEKVDPLNNVFYISEMLPRQVKVDDMLRAKIDGDPELREALVDYREKAASFPFGVPHFGLRYASTDSLAPVLEKLRNGLSPALKKRISVNVSPAFDEVMEDLPEVLQTFVYTDVIVTGSSSLGQLIELQIQRKRH